MLFSMWRTDSEIHMLTWEALAGSARIAPHCSTYAVNKNVNQLHSTIYLCSEQSDYICKWFRFKKNKIKEFMKKNFENPQMKIFFYK